MARISSKGIKSWREVEKMLRDMSTDFDALTAIVNEMRTDHATQITFTTEVEADLDTVANYNHYQNEVDGVIDGDYTFAAQAATTILGAGAVRYRIDGVEYYNTVVGNITLAVPGTSPNINDTMFGAWRVLINRAGTITTQATSADMQLEYGAVDGTRALISLSAIAPTAGTACLGYVSLKNTSGAAAFVIGTTNTNTTCTVAPYYERTPRKKATGLHAALGAATAASAGLATLSVGTIDPTVNGDRLAQIAADATDDMADADTIATGNSGGWLLCTDLAGTGTTTVASNGAAMITVSAMTDAGVAAANTALGLVCDYLPFMFCPIARITVVNVAVGTFTAATSLWDAAGFTTVVTDAAVGTWDRTNLTGFDTHKINPPTLPDNITAPQVASITAGAVTLTTSQT